MSLGTKLIIAFVACEAAGLVFFILALACKDK